MSQQTNGQIVSIQYLRALAALLVIFQHAHEQIVGLKSYMDTSTGSGGVDLFFIISGVVMVHSTFRRSMTRKEFLVRRIERIAPLYWAITCLTAVLLIFGKGLVDNSVFTTESFLKSILFIPGQNPSKDEISPMLKLGWTLNFEMFFYIVFAVFLRLAPLKRILCITATFLVFYAWGRVIGSHWKPVQFWSDPILFEFILGCLLGYLDLKGLTRHLPQWLIVSALLVAVISFAALADVPISRLWVRGLPALVIVAAFIAIERRQLFHFVDGLVHRVGDASYSIYLSHLYVVIAVRLLWTHAHLPQGPLAALSFVILCYAGGLALGLLVYFLVEKPLISHFSRVRRRQRALSLAAPA